MSLPPLIVKPPSRGVRMLSTIFGGVREVADQIEPYTDWWNIQNDQAITNQGPLIAVIGDSMSLGIGASAPDKGYLGLIRDQLVANDGQPWQMVNLGQWGDKLSDGIERQLPALAGIRQPDHLIVCIGSNDMVWGASLGKVRRGMRTIAEAVPGPAQICTLIGSSPRSIIANRSLITIANETGHEIVNPWFKWRGKQASDRFHPDDEGYVMMASAFCAALGVEYSPIAEPQPVLSSG